MQSLLLMLFMTISQGVMLSASDQSCSWAVTARGGGLFGDKLLLYAKAKWFSFAYNIPFVYKPFMYSEKLALHSIEISKKDKSINHKLFTTKDIPPLHCFLELSSDNTLYQIGLSSADPQWQEYAAKIQEDEYVLHDIDVHNVRTMMRFDAVNDPSCIDEQLYIVPEEFYFNHLYYASRDNKDFLLELRKAISPAKKINLIPLPQGVITVALHMRMGGEFEQFKKLFPQEISTRVPEESYYIEQLSRLSVTLGDKPLFVYIFTNHKKPQVLLEKVKKAVNKKNIEFTARDSSSSSLHLLEDLFSMARFDCLIRPNSAFSQIAQLIGDHKIIIYPRAGFWNKENLTIYKVGLIVNDESFL